MRKPKRKIITRIIVITFIIIIIYAAYLAADRYLIEHVEIENADTGMAAAQSSEIISDTKNQTTLDKPDNTGSIIADDWNYSGNGTSVSIQKVSTGSGNDKVTYFAADIQLSDATDLMSAFAKNQYGRNIIEDTSKIADDNNAVFAFNGDYYGFRNDGIMIRNGVIYRDDPAREGFAFYKDGSVRIYNEKTTSAQKLVDEGVWNTLSFGPALLENSVIPTNLTDIEVDTNFGNHSIQGNQPRTGIGIIDKNHFVVIVADGRSKGYSRGVTMPEFAGIFKDLGCTDAYNLDGGGSSTMYFMGRVVNNPLGRNSERGVSDILYIAK